MECETCRGQGRTFTHDYTQERVFIGFAPCPNCGGTGQQSCCEGMVGGPGEATNGAKPLLRPGTHYITTIRTGATLLPGPRPYTWIVTHPDEAAYLLDLSGNKTPL